MNAEAIGMNPGGELVVKLPLAPRGHGNGNGSSSFALGQRDGAILRAGSVESLPMAKAATQPGARAGKLTGERIREALDKLTPRERMVFELKHYQGLKLRTIGEMLSTTEETAKNTLFRATRKLRTNLAELRGT